jgi:two-component system, OmpR family, heavy metal sensor histidine kinase CusS
MFSKRTEPRSIASQLVLLFTLAATLLLSCGLGVFYAIVVRQAFVEDNAVLADKFFAIRSEIKKTDGLKALDDELHTLRSGERAVYWVRVLDPGGRTVAETPTMNELLPARVFPAPQVAGAAAVTPQDHRANARLFSLLTSVEPVDGQAYTIQVAQDRSGDEEFTKQFGALFAIVLGVGVFASAAIAITVTKRGLRPLADITRSLKHVEPSHFNERVAPEAWPRELRPLAVAFDEMLDRLQESFTRLSQFSADLAHELRTPLANVLGEAEVALTRPRTSDEYREVIESCVAECARLAGIIDNLLFLARAETADRQTHPTLFDGRATIEKIATYYRTVAEEHHVAITCVGEGQIRADPLLFGRALSNLLDNALRFTPAGGTILISVVVRDTQSEVSVKDTGCGMATEHIPRVFHRFYRVDPSRSSEGVGLGLALVKSITDLHGGTATLQSEVNGGTRVTLTFPNRPISPATA